MATRNHKLLLVEDSNLAAKAVMAAFEKGDMMGEPVEVVRQTSLQGALQYVQMGAGADLDIVLLDLGLPDSQGIDTLLRFKEVNDVLPVIVLTGTDNMELSLEALRLGAQNYLIKDETYARMLQREVRYATQRKSLDLELLRAKTEAEESTRIKEKFVSLVAHDIRGPLTSIFTTLEILTGKDAHELSAGASKRLARVADSAKLLQRIVDELLDINRLRTGKIKPSFRFVDAFHVVQQAIAKVQLVADDKGVTLASEVEKGQRLYTDPGLLGQVLQNLLSNAIKFSHPGGAVRVYPVLGEPASVAVEDHGVGIPADKVSRLFNIDEKNSTPGTSGETGTGFGLPYSNDLMDAIGGEIRVESAENDTTTFVAALPRVVPQVLVVEDEAMLRQLMAMHLQAIGANVVEASNGVEALQYIKDHGPPHLILSDIQMPKMDGLELLTILKGKPGTESIPVIMVTGDEQIETRDEALRLGALDFTIKPIVTQDFLPRVRRVIA